MDGGMDGGRDGGREGWREGGKDGGREGGGGQAEAGLPSAWFMRTIHGSGSGGAALVSPDNASERESCRVTASATAGAHEELGK